MEKFLPKFNNLSKDELVYELTNGYYSTLLSCVGKIKLLIEKDAEEGAIWVTSQDIANTLGYSRAQVKVALGTIVRDGYLESSENIKKEYYLIHNTTKEIQELTLQETFKEFRSGTLGEGLTDLGKIRIVVEKMKKEGASCIEVNKLASLFEGRTEPISWALSKLCEQGIIIKTKIAITSCTLLLHTTPVV